MCDIKLNRTDNKCSIKFTGTGEVWGGAHVSGGTCSMGPFPREEVSGGDCLERNKYPAFSNNKSKAALSRTAQGITSYYCSMVTLDL